MTLPPRPPAQMYGVLGAVGALWLLVSVTSGCDWDILRGIARAAALAWLVVYLALNYRRTDPVFRRGWACIAAGAALISAGTAFGVVEAFRDGKHTIHVADAPPLIVLSAYVAGPLLLGAGFWLWITSVVAERRRTAEELDQAGDQLWEALMKANEYAVQAEIAANAKAEFLARISHEIRTPLNGVIGMSRLLLDTQLNDEQRQYADTVKISGEVLVELINDVLDFAKLEAPGFELESVPFDLREAIHECAGLLAASASDRGLAIVLRYRPDIPTGFVGDVGRLRQVLLNLGSNAIKFTDSGRAVFDVERIAMDAGDGRQWLRISVTDTGIGIAQDRIAIIFDQFTQAGTSTARMHGGSGLGLAISRELVELMGGTIAVTSEVGRGSTFYCDVPLTAAASERVFPVPVNGLEAARILIVSDLPISRAILRDQIASWGIDVSAAAGPVEARDLMRAAELYNSRYDIIVCDCSRANDVEGHMAELHSLGLNPGGAKVVVVVAADARPEIGGGGEIAALVTRPVRPSRLMDALSTAVNPSSALPVAVSSKIEQVFAGVRVLIAEDNAANQLVARRMLEKLGCRVDADRPAVPGDDAAHAHHAQPGAVALRREEGVEDAFAELLGHPDAGVGHDHLRAGPAVVRLLAHLDADVGAVQFARPAAQPFLHGVAGVRQHVHQHALDLGATGEDQRALVPAADAELDRRVAARAARGRPTAQRARRGRSPPRASGARGAGRAARGRRR